MTAYNGPLLDDFWDGTAGGYDRWYVSPQGAMYDFLEKRAAAWALRGGQPPASPGAANADLCCPPTNGVRLLEVGCGTGRWAAWLAGQGYRVTGIDRSANMLAMAHQRMQQLAPPTPAISPVSTAQPTVCGQSPATICWAAGDATNLPVAENAFDVAISVATLDYLGDGPGGRGLAEKAVSEMARAVRCGGRLVIGVFNRLAPLNIKRMREEGPPWDGARMFSPEELLELLAPYGPAGVRVTAWLPDDDRQLPQAPAMDHQFRQAGRDDGLMLFGWVDLAG